MDRGIPMNHFKPTVFWLTGLSGAGKTTLGHILTNKLRCCGYPVIFLDGDILREVFDSNIGHDRESRLAAAIKYSKLCKMLVDQQVHVVCATISLFHTVQEWNRTHIENYIEIFLDVPLDELIKRNSKNIYSRALSSEVKNVVGIDIPAEFPKLPDIVILNDANSKQDENISLILAKYDSLRENKSDSSTNTAVEAIIN